MLYSLVAIVALVVIVFLNYEPLFNKNYPATNKRALGSYRLLLIVSCFFLITDILWGILDPLENKLPVTIDTNVFFIAMTATVFAWTRFVYKYLEDRSIFNRLLIVFGIVFSLFGLNLVMANFFTPVIFSYEPNAYTPIVYRYVYFSVQIVIFLATFVYTVGYYIRSDKRKSKNIQYIAVAAYSLMMIISTVLQLFFPLLPAYSIGVCLALTVLHTFVVLREKANFRQAIAENESKVKEQSAEIDVAKELAYTDPLTGVKNKHAYVELENQIDIDIREGKIEDFSVLIFDLNNLKQINDLYGHEVGDQYIIKSVQAIKEHFPNEEIYRYGGDEFVIVINNKEHYEKRFECLDEFNKHIEDNIAINGPIVAVGFSDFIREKDNTMRPVFIRADERMYSRKRKLKELAGGGEENTAKAKGQSTNNVRLGMYEMFYHGENFSLIDMLNGSNCDEIVEVDLNNDTFKQYYHVAGKYFVPTVGLSYKELVDFTIQHIVHPDDLGAYLSLMKIDGFFERLASARIPNFDFAHFRYKLQDGDYRYVEQVVITGEENGIPPGMFRMYVFDINNLKSRQLGKVGDDSSLISFGRDPITGLYANKDFFIEGEKLIKETPDVKYCLVSLDIEHFKFFDEWFGREQGDVLLAKIGGVLKDFEDNYKGVAGYLGQDDYIILLPFNMDAVNELYNKIRDQINTFGLSAGFLPAFGVSPVEKDMVLVDAFDRATVASSKAKDDLKNRIIVYNEQMQFLAEEEYKMLTDFIYALQAGEITFHLQPQVRTSSGTIVGAEALARWQKKDGKFVSAHYFVSILEKYGFVTDLDKFIWESVCKWIHKNLNAKKNMVPISVNVSRVDIFNIDVAKHFHDLCEKYDIPHNLLKIEITESAYADITNIIDDLVGALRKDGFVVLMDDFGSGYSSLNMLSSLKLDAIKLDANFLRMQGRGESRGIHILESVVNMAKNMSLPIVVEGVETKKQLNFLTELGCQYAQGYFYYRPMPTNDFEKIIADKSKFDLRGFVVKSNEQFRVREFLDKNIYSDSMLNTILGAVAIYAWNKEKNSVDIVRFNEQFYQAVNLPEFSERLTEIENYVPEPDRPLLFEALREAVSNKLNGSVAILRFYRTDGTICFFHIHFYYIGKKEGLERFYGSAINVTELAYLRDTKSLIAKYSSDNLIFIRRVKNSWNFGVISHRLSDLMGLSPEELEAGLNNGEFFVKRFSRKDSKSLFEEAERRYQKKEDFVRIFDIIGIGNEVVKMKLTFTCVMDESNSIDYILKTTIL